MAEKEQNKKLLMIRKRMVKAKLVAFTIECTALVVECKGKCTHHFYLASD